MTGAYPPGVTDNDPHFDMPSTDDPYDEPMTNTPTVDDSLSALRTMLRTIDDRAEDPEDREVVAAVLRAALDALAIFADVGDCSDGCACIPNFAMAVSAAVTDEHWRSARGVGS